MQHIFIIEKIFIYLGMSTFIEIIFENTFIIWITFIILHSFRMNN